MTEFSEDEVDEHLRELHIKEGEDLARMLAEKYGIPYLNLDTISIDTDSLAVIPESIARDAGLAVIQIVGRNIKIGLRAPNHDSAQALLEDLKRKRYIPQLFLVSTHSLEKAWEKYKEVSTVKAVEEGVVELRATSDITKAARTIRSLADLTNTLSPLLEAKEDRKTSGTLEVLLQGALNLGTSDIHIEAEEKETRLRVRIDGVLEDVTFFSERIYLLLLSRIKLLSGIKLNIKNRAQDGRFTIRTDDIDIEVRTSTLPGPHGESIVMRLLNPKTIDIGLKDLGMQDPVRILVEEELKKPNGMILTTGPTGSGKTTTLYSFLREVNNTNINIITIEDPIEYHLTGVNQTQVNTEKGYDFNNGLRSILRQDPDIILVGEIRDRDTAEIAMHAALTGHLVFSTLHTNNAPGTIPRLIDLEVDPSIIAPAINIAMAQRLVRRLCEHCKEGYILEGEELASVKEMVRELPKPYTTPPLSGATIWRAKGCASCNNTGYTGRIGIFEVFRINDEIEHLILERPSEADVREAAEKQGMLTMQQDGILKMLAGITSISEVERVTGE
ncbi:MAG: hypothetical protein COU90_03960 [Candidatus Ryanbacteria bacterium CG10_big_fil_rev_8_21_14_0_10_43_42]|uniref:Bacterial type II secretion system protein E domain-containing protein n=1 Tax=Candidatus Ryanbacteria bacterium CG10_big_fil_rev_8_21_14_0_10_43_42 TaxID=1974864 RepID=A0A2M8KWD5_9BACT|nr:MAG: hypothetical protein COU90_03960 [Candidatus Ryanbacteria bacterium CG10_big_fil_rev_8_21_14_0_10_43_42]